MIKTRSTLRFGSEDNLHEPKGILGNPEADARASFIVTERINVKGIAICKLFQMNSLLQL